MWGRLKALKSKKNRITTRHDVCSGVHRAVKTDISIRSKKAARRVSHQLRAQQSGSQLERRSKGAGG